MQRERWATKIGLVLALAGNAIGLGNFLRFPRQAALNGGGAFLIPYFVCLLAIGIPLMWVELAIGRRGGRYGRGHTAGMFELLWKHPAAKYVGALGLFMPFTICCYYAYVTSWCLAYSFFSATGAYFDLHTPAEIGRFLAGFQGVESNDYFSSRVPAYAFYLTTFAVTIGILLGGVARGIERLALLAMPLLFLFAIALVVRVLTLDPPPGAAPDQNVLSGLGFVWNPDFSALREPKVWLAAAGQIFFTLSVGWGIIHTYASYVEPDDDIALTGLSTASLNEFAEVVLGGTIALTASVVFFGVLESRAVAASGSFNLGFQTMPLVLEQLPAGRLFGTLWFLLLFFAGLTSAVALLQPLIAMLREDFGLARDRAVLVTGGLLFLGTQPVIFFLQHGFMDQLDFWAGSFGLLLFGFLEILIFVWAFGLENAWEEITRGAKIAVPRGFRFVIAWVMPLGLGAILLSWSATELVPALSIEKIPEASRPYVIGSWAMMAGMLLAFWAAVRAGKRRRGRADTGESS
ncbi:MAG TPA: sodium-dependent transporter [Myxococcota bacterium]|nr:sodium-dependent transporter [Myxococcota bacterium]